MIEYLVMTKNINCNYYFNYFLKFYRIRYEYLSNTQVYIITTTPCYINCIKNLPYILSVIKNEFVSTCPEPPPIPVVLPAPPSSDISDTPKMDWGIYKINAPNMWSKGITGKGVNVAIIDSGIAIHKGLKNVKERISFLDDDKSPDDFSGHGTAVAGVIGMDVGDIRGVAYDCNLYGLKVSNRLGEINLEAISKAILWCIDNNINVINISLGINKNTEEGAKFIPMLADIVRLAYTNGIIIVASSGNCNTSDDVLYPAAFDDVIGIGATTQEDKRWVEEPLGSNYGVGLDFMAPGKLIFTTTIKNGYGFFSGTSFASPFTAGLVALLLSEDKTRTFEDVFKILKDNAIPLPKDNPNKLEYGYGLIQCPK